MNLKRRVEKLETHFFEDKRYQGCEFETVIDVEGDNKLFCISSDGTRRQVSGTEAEKIMKSVNKFTVDIID